MPWAPIHGVRRNRKQREYDLLLFVTVCAWNWDHLIIGKYGGLLVLEKSRWFTWTFIYLFIFILEFIYFTPFRERETKPILTPLDGQRGHFSLSGIRTCDHPHENPKLSHCATGEDISF